MPLEKEGHEEVKNNRSVKLTVLCFEAMELIVRDVVVERLMMINYFTKQ